MQQGENIGVGKIDTATRCETRNIKMIANLTSGDKEDNTVLRK